MDLDGLLREREVGRLTHMGSACPAGSSGAARSVRELESELGVCSLSGEVWLPPPISSSHADARGSKRRLDGLSIGLPVCVVRRLPLLRVLVELAGLVPVRDAQQGSGRTCAAWTWRRRRAYSGHARTSSRPQRIRTC
jgi:hypothetical protein